MSFSGVWYPKIDSMFVDLPSFKETFKGRTYTKTPKVAMIVDGTSPDDESVHTETVCTGGGEQVYECAMEAEYDG